MKRVEVVKGSQRDNLSLPLVVLWIVNVREKKIDIEKKKNCVYALKGKHASHKMEMKTDRFQEIIIFVEYFAESLEMETLSS